MLVPENTQHLTWEPLTVYDAHGKVQKHGVNNSYSNYSSILTYDENGFNDYSPIFDQFEDAYSVLEEMAGAILADNLQDRNTRAGLTRSGWQPKKNMKMQAVEWWEWGT
jgi:polyamine oxidase